MTTRRKRRRKRPQYDRCRSLALAYLERRETPPGPCEMARLAGCSKATASRATSWLLAVMAEGSRSDARETLVDTWNEN